MNSWNSGSFLLYCQPVLWGFANIFVKLSTPKLGVTRIAGLVVVIEGMMYFAGFFFWHNNASIDLEYGALAAASAFVGMVGYLCFFESVVDGQVAIVGTISAAYPSLTVIGALAFLSESLTSYAIGRSCCYNLRHRSLIV